MKSRERPSELGRSCSVFQKWKAANNLKKKECGERQQEVGLIRSKGVVGVMPSAGNVAHLKGSAIVCRDLKKQVLNMESDNTCKRN